MDIPAALDEISALGVLGLIYGGYGRQVRRGRRRRQRGPLGLGTKFREGLCSPNAWVGGGGAEMWGPGDNTLP